MSRSSFRAGLFAHQAQGTACFFDSCVRECLKWPLVRDHLRLKLFFRKIRAQQHPAWRQERSELRYDCPSEASTERGISSIRRSADVFPAAIREAHLLTMLSRVPKITKTAGESAGRMPYYLPRGEENSGRKARSDEQRGPNSIVEGRWRKKKKKTAPPESPQ